MHCTCPFDCDANCAVYIPRTRGDKSALCHLCILLHTEFSLYGAQVRRRSTCHAVSGVLHLCVLSLDSPLCHLCTHPASDAAFERAQRAQQEMIRQKCGNPPPPPPTSRVKYAALAFQTQKWLKLKNKVPHEFFSSFVNT